VHLGCKVLGNGSHYKPTNTIGKDKWIEIVKQLAKRFAIGASRFDQVIPWLNLFVRKSLVHTATISAREFDALQKNGRHRLISGQIFFCGLKLNSQTLRQR
jgi:hypothetical protein